MDRSIYTFGIAGLLCALPACDRSADPAPESEAVTTASILLAHAELENASGATIGEANLSDDAGTLTLSVTASTLEPGSHGLHLHERGACELPDFKSAGSHLNPDNRTHGNLSDTGAHLGDLLNIEIDDTGNGSTRLAIRGPLESAVNAIFDEDGTAVVIHADPDDYITAPSGAAGPRAACGVLRQALQAD